MLADDATEAKSITRVIRYVASRKHAVGGKRVLTFNCFEVTRGRSRTQGHGSLRLSR